MNDDFIPITNKRTIDACNRAEDTLIAWIHQAEPVIRETLDGEVMQSRGLMVNILLRVATSASRSMGVPDQHLKDLLDDILGYHKAK